VPGEFGSNSNLRVIQDQKTSFIGGYFLNVRVPKDNHLRLYGKSSKVFLSFFKSFIFLSIQARNFEIEFSQKII
jgi:hypothetical protein